MNDRAKKPGNTGSQPLLLGRSRACIVLLRPRDEVGPWGTSRELYANTIPSLGASFACWRRRVWVKMDVVPEWRFRLGSFDPEIQEKSKRCFSDTAIH